jgi:hypothetical protein
MANEITITQGDDVTLTLRLKSSGEYHDLTGAGSLEAKFLGENGSDVAVSSGITVDPDQVTNKGKLTIALGNASTSLFRVAENQNILIKIVQASKVLQFHGVKVLRVRDNSAKQPT